MDRGRRAFVLAAATSLAFAMGAGAANADVLDEDSTGTWADNTYSGTINPGGTPIASGTQTTDYTLGQFNPNSGCPSAGYDFSATVTLAETGTGDTITKTETGVACINGLVDLNASGSYTITGGTGRFAGATGSGTFTFYLSFVAAPFASATEDGTIAPCTRMVTGHVPGAVSIRSGEVVCFQNATVGGAVTVQPGGSFRSTGSTFSGAITSTGAKEFRLCGSTVGGTVKVQSSTGPVQIGDDDANCAPNTLRSGLTVSGNAGGYEVTGNQIAGTTTIANNASGPGEESEVKNNRMSSSLNCSGNTPPPTGGGNTTSGGKTGQCSGL
jgi:hypothetical protein